MKLKYLLSILLISVLSLTSCDLSFTIGGQTSSDSSSESIDIDTSPTEEDDDDDGVIHVESISFFSSTLSVYTGDKFDIASLISVKPDNADDKSYSLYSSDLSVISINGTTLNCLKEGNALVTATTTDLGLTASCLVTVKDNETGESQDPDVEIPEDEDEYYKVELDKILSPSRYMAETEVVSLSDGNLYYWSNYSYDGGSTPYVGTYSYNANSATYDFSWSTTGSTLWWDMQLFLKLPKDVGLTNGSMYSLTLEFNANFNDSITVNGNVIQVVNGFNSVSIDNLFSSDNSADISIQMGVESTNSCVTNGTISFSLIAFSWTLYGGDYTTLIWSDEFEGSSLDKSKWSYQTGGGYGAGEPGFGWGNNELEWYQESNVSTANGNLLISAKKEHIYGTDDYYQYTSGRIRTFGLFDLTYGKVEARIKYDTQTGMWPAFWLLPVDSSIYGTWPSSGEIDIFEGKGRLPYWGSSALHYGNVYDEYKSTEYTLNSPASEWHTYSVIWATNNISYYCDDSLTMSINSNQWYSGGDTSSETAPFDVPFYIILNLAVGGNFDDNKSPESSFTSANMYVDYVRVYK
ncbi:MAG: family 16 glycosylhydrolase [Coprobacillus sp.]|nr:family 16 glycosylhydrolase [Coprobacillus sp.]